MVYVLVCCTYRTAKMKQRHGKPQQIQQRFHAQGVQTLSTLLGLFININCSIFVIYIIWKLIAEGLPNLTGSEIIFLRHLKNKSTELLLRGKASIILGILHVKFFFLKASTVVNKS